MGRPASEVHPLQLQPLGGRSQQRAVRHGHREMPLLGRFALRAVCWIVRVFLCVSFGEFQEVIASQVKNSFVMCCMYNNIQITAKIKHSCCTKVWKEEKGIRTKLFSYTVSIFPFFTVLTSCILHGMTNRGQIPRKKFPLTKCFQASEARNATSVQLVLYTSSR